MIENNKNNAKVIILNNKYVKIVVVKGGLLYEYERGINKIKRKNKRIVYE